VVILDSHTDIIDFNIKHSLLNSPIENLTDNLPDIYECGSFMGFLLKENLIKPDRLWIIGTQDILSDNKALEAEQYIKRMQYWLRKGVNLVSKTDLIKGEIPKDIEGPTYISIDADIGSYSCVLACRFMDRIGINYADLKRILYSLSVLIRSKKILLIGLDFMEIDVHFLNEEVLGKSDRTLELLKIVFDELILPT